MNDIKTGKSQNSSGPITPEGKVETNLPSVQAIANNDSFVKRIEVLEKNYENLSKAVEQMRLIDVPRLIALTKNEDKPVLIPEQKNHNPDRLPMGGEPRSYHQALKKEG